MPHPFCIPSPTGTPRRLAATRGRAGAGVRMPDRSNRCESTDLQSTPIRGSGPIVLGRAAEVGCSGTQAVQVLRERVAA